MSSNILISFEEMLPRERLRLEQLDMKVKAQWSCWIRMRKRREESRSIDSVGSCSWSRSGNKPAMTRILGLGKRSL